MKNLFVVLFIAIFLQGFSQVQPSPEVQGVIDSLRTEYRVASQISDDPTLSLKRVVSLNYVTWYSKAHHATVQFDIHYLHSDGTYFQSRVLGNPQKATFPLNRSMYVDSQGNDITQAEADSLQDSSNEYDFLLNLLDSGYNYIDLIEAKITELDSEGKFD